MYQLLNSARLRPGIMLSGRIGCADDEGLDLDDSEVEALRSFKGMTGCGVWISKVLAVITIIDRRTKGS
ncbi:uncharacterized protein G2W53_012016 [Senna tora]|uniref:Uncharacterized protein n=1 Tax=Senna tora TaxID=362788 RepID=A0A834WQE0_9FABA|nr:uncharacterized protein G2W53_012016 [Senna tora]